MPLKHQVFWTCVFSSCIKNRVPFSEFHFESPAPSFSPLGLSLSLVLLSLDTCLPSVPFLQERHDGQSMNKTHTVFFFYTQLDLHFYCASPLMSNLGSPTLLMEGRREEEFCFYLVDEDTVTPVPSHMSNSSPFLHTFLFLPFGVIVKYAFKENQSKIVVFSYIAPLLQDP